VHRKKGATGKALMLCDPNASFTRALGLSLDLSAFALGACSQRYSMVVQDGLVATINAEKSILTMKPALHPVCSRQQRSSVSACSCPRVLLHQSAPRNPSARLLREQRKPGTV
jgi:hypothetical protein